MTNIIHRYPRERDQMSINLLRVWATSENLKQTLRSHKIKSTFYTDSTLHKVFWKLKDPVATEDKNYILYEIDCSKCEAAYFCESKRSLKSRQINTKDLSQVAILKKIKQNTVGKHITTSAGSSKELLMGKAGQILGRSKKIYILWRITFTKFPTRFPK